MNHWDKNLEEGFQLHEHAVYPSRNVIISPDGEQHIEPKAMLVLLFLASNPNKVIPRLDFLEQVWPDTITGEEVLTRCISLLRSALGENNHHNYLETVPKKGYRLIVPVKPLNCIEEDETDKMKRRKFAMVIGALALFAVAILVVVTEYNYKTDVTPSIAVMPFVNMSSDPEQEYFSDGISEEILNVLSQVPNLQVTSRSSTFQFRDKNIDIPTVARQLGVAYVLEGSVRKSGDRIRISAQLIEAETDKHLWSETYDREPTDVFVIQDEISAAIVSALKSKLGLELKVVKREMGAVNLEAYNEYLKGRFFIEKRTQKDLEKALSHFNKAIEISPEYAPAWMGKAWASIYLSETLYGDIVHNVAVERAKPAAEKALLLDPELPEAYAIRGFIETMVFNHQKAIPYLEKAIELNPNNADAYSWYSFTQYNFPEKQLELRKKSVHLNPMSFVINKEYGDTLNRFGRYKEAEAVVKQMFAIDDSNYFAYFLLADIKWRQGNYGEAAYFRQKAARLNPTAKIRHFSADMMVRINLPELTTGTLVGTRFEAFDFFFKNNYESFISEVRTSFPRSEKDFHGYYYCGLAEIIAGNYEDAVKHFRKSMCKSCDYLIFSLLQTGDTISANVLLDERKKQYESRLKSGIVLQDIDAMNIAFLEGNIEKAIQYLDDAMKRGYILRQRYRDFPMYESLRKHPDWPAILEESERRAVLQREIYLKLVAEEAGTVQ